MNINKNHQEVFPRGYNDIVSRTFPHWRRSYILFKFQRTFIGCIESKRKKNIYGNHLHINHRFLSDEFNGWFYKLLYLITLFYVHKKPNILDLFSCFTATKKLKFLQQRKKNQAQKCWRNPPYMDVFNGLA